MLKQKLWKGTLGVAVSMACLGGLPAYSQPEAILAQSSPTIVASEDISSTELEQFAKAIVDLRKIDEKTQAKMIEAVQDAGMSPEEFMEIGKQEDAPMNLSADKQMKFEKALNAVRELNEQDRMAKREAVEDAGLDISRFNEIGKKVESDRNLQKQVVEILSR